MSALLAVHVQHNYPAMLHVVVPAHRAADNVLTLQGYQSIQCYLYICHHCYQFIYSAISEQAAAAPVLL